MEAQKCDCIGCNNELRTFDEVMFGICTDHQNAMLNDDTYVGICWNCCRVTVMGPRRNPKGKMIIPDKYIFSKTCRHCSVLPEAGIDWMTIRKDTPSSTFVTIVETDKGPKGRILPITESIKN